jgi:hypothetical protein
MSSAGSSASSGSSSSPTAVAAPPIPFNIVLDDIQQLRVRQQVLADDIDSALCSLVALASQLPNNNVSIDCTIKTANR